MHCLNPDKGKEVANDCVRKATCHTYRKDIKETTKSRIKNLCGAMGRGLTLNDPGGSPSFSSTIVVQLGPRLFGIHYSSFPPDFSELSPDFSRVLFHVDKVFTIISSHFHSRQSCCLKLVERDPMHATRWRKTQLSLVKR